MSGTPRRNIMVQQIEPLAVNINEACRLLGIGRTSLYALVKEGRLELRRIGSSVITLRSIRRLVDEADQGPDDDRRKQAAHARAVRTAKLAAQRAEAEKTPPPEAAPEVAPETVPAQPKRTGRDRKARGQPKARTEAATRKRRETAAKQREIRAAAERAADEAEPPPEVA
jgi:excisionase family DNA binding protein